MQTAENLIVGRIILVRHGESEGNRDRTFTQNTEVPITAGGCEQAHAAALQIVKRYRPARLVASPFTRARQTAEIIAETLQLPVEIDEAFQEQSFGALAGQPYDALLADPAYLSSSRWQWRPQGGESLSDVYERVVPAFERLAQTSAGGDVVIVSHGGVMVALCAYVMGSWDGASVTPNAGIVAVEPRDGKWRVISNE